MYHTDIFTARQRMDGWGQKAYPFPFVIDFEMDHPLMIPFRNRPYYIQYDGSLALAIPQNRRTSTPS
ncbi:MAG: hypothetical protein IPN33_20425, partial [Saprospiraceae bacterium]|nr:hypothetical protein [Saprospiraceae bacterium]